MYTANSKVIKLTPGDFSGRVLQRQGIPALVMFYAAWCPHCQNAEPLWTEFANKENGANVCVVDCVAHEDLAQSFEIRGFPTIKVFDASGKLKGDYSDQRDLKNLQAFVKSLGKGNVSRQSKKKSSGSSSGKKSSKQKGAGRRSGAKVSKRGRRVVRKAYTYRRGGKLVRVPAKYSK